MPPPPQVVYSSSARELKVETVKPETPEKEEDDIDIDAIWETRMEMTLSCVVAFTHNVLLQIKWLAFPSLTTCSPLPPSSALWHDLT